MPEDKMTFGQTIRAIRLNQEIGLRELARRVGITSAYLSKIESGDFPPPAADKIEKIAKELRVSADSLFALTDRMPSDVDEVMKQDREKVLLLLRRSKDLSVEDINRMFDQAHSKKDKP